MHLYLSIFHNTLLLLLLLLLQPPREGSVVSNDDSDHHDGPEALSGVEATAPSKTVEHAVFGVLYTLSKVPSDTRALL